MAEQQVSTNKFGISDWIVDGGGIANGATHTTIAAAFSSASSGDTIYIRPGTYTENLTIPVGINVTSLPGNNAQGNVNIIGKLTQTATGTSTFANLRLTTNSDVILDIGGSGGIQTEFQRCSFFLGDGDGITINNASASPNFTDCSFHQTGNTLDYFNITACSTTTFMGCSFFSTGTIGTSDVDAGTVIFINCNLHQLLTCSGAALYKFDRCSWNPNQNVTFLTTAGTGTTTIKDLTLVSGTAAAISIGSGTTVEANQLSIKSTNANPITGAGTLIYSCIENTGTGSGINVTTQTPHYRALGQPSFSANVSTAITNVTGDGTAYSPVIYDTEVFDIGSNYDSTTGIFTAPVDGKYVFSFANKYEDLETAMTKIFEILITSNRNYITQRSNIGALRSGANDFEWMSWSTVIADMDAGDTANVSITIQGGTLAVDVGISSFFQGYLLG